MRVSFARRPTLRAVFTNHGTGFLRVADSGTDGDQMRKMLPVILTMAVCSLGSAQAPKRIDAGTLTITANTPMGTKVSTEEFTIVQNAEGGFTMTIVASGGRKMRSVLTTDSAGTPTAYEHHGRGGEAIEKTITSRRDDTGALVISEVSTRNPPLTPFRLPPNTMLFGDGGIAQYWFLGLGPIPREVSYLQTNQWRSGTAVARVSETGRESVTIEGSPVDASHLVLGEGSMRREVWLDSQKRLLKVSLGTSLVAVRTTRPK